jgi:protein-S-isoprenylcysteine O-methyltransferase Ste14
MPDRLSWLRAADLEFRVRFWIVGGVFWLGFSRYSAGDTNFAVSVAQWLAGAGSPHVTAYTRLILGFGTALTAAAALIRSWAEAYLHSSVVHDPKLHSERLTADGPYRFVRNPLYLGNVLLALGIGTMAGRFGFAIIVAGNIVIVYRLILREEAGLLASQGQSYREYFRAVPRLMPALRPRLPVGRARPDWMDGFTGETFMWGMALGIAAFTVTLRIVYWAVPAGAGFAVYAVQAVRRRASPNSGASTEPRP